MSPKVNNSKSDKTLTPGFWSHLEHIKEILITNHTALCFVSLTRELFVNMKKKFIKFRDQIINSPKMVFWPLSRAMAAWALLTLLVFCCWLPCFTKYGADLFSKIFYTPDTWSTRKRKRSALCCWWLLLNLVLSMLNYS